MIKEDFVIKAYCIQTETHLKILEKIKNEYKISSVLMENHYMLELFNNLSVQYRVSPKSKSFGYIIGEDTGFYKVNWKIKKFIDYKIFLNPHILTMETE